MRPAQILIIVAAAIAAAVAVLAAANAGGWRARVISRLLRVDNPPLVVAPPTGFVPTAPDGFSVSVFARGFEMPRWLAVAPNGDVFVADSAAGQIVVLRPSMGAVAEPSRTIFTDRLNLPFGIAFNAEYVYVANTNEVVRFRYDRRTSTRLGNAEHVLDLPGLGYRQHWTRSIAFSADGRQLFASVGSESNISVESDPRRAAIVTADPDGNQARIYASGLRNAVGLAIEPETGDLWAAVNERDNLGDDTPPDYFTRVTEGGFFGWPYSYIGGHVDNRVPLRRDLVDRATVPDVLLTAHAAPMQISFYTGRQFPESYRYGAFIAEHGSWNRRARSGYDVVFVPFRGGHPAGEPATFLTGFVPNRAGREVYGRVVGVAMLADGSLVVSDDGARVIWRVSRLAGTAGDSADRQTRPPL